MKFFTLKKTMILCIHLYLILSNYLISSRITSKRSYKRIKNRKRDPNPEKVNANQNNQSDPKLNPANKKNENVIREITPFDRQDKHNFRLFYAMKFVILANPIFQPLEFIIDRAKYEMDPVNNGVSPTKCGRNQITKAYYNFISTNKNEVKKIKLGEDLKKGLNRNGILSSNIALHNIFIGDCKGYIKDEISSKVNEGDDIVEEIEKNNNVGEIAQNAQVCLKTISYWIQNPTKVDFTIMNPLCQELLPQLGCTLDKTKIVECLNGKKNAGGKVDIESPVSIVESLSKLDPKLNVFKKNDIIKKLEGDRKIECKSFKGIYEEEQKKQLSTLHKYSLRFKGLMESLNTFLNCNGIYKVFVSIWKKVSVKTIMRMVANLLKLSRLPKATFRHRYYINGFMYSFQMYIKKRDEALQTPMEELDTRLTHLIFMSEYFGLSVNYIIRFLFFTFKTDDWLPYFEPNSKLLTEINIDNVQNLFVSWNIE